MKILSSIRKRIQRLFLYTHALIYSFIVKRKIVIRETGTYGQDNFWQTSFQVTVSALGQRINLEFLRAAMEETKFNKAALAIKIAEDICREMYLPPTPTFIKVEEDIIVVTIKEN